MDLLRPTGAPPPGTRSACLALQLTPVRPSQVEHDEDIYYSGNERESDEHCCERAVAFLQWLNARPEKCIAVVTHSSFLRHLFTQFGGNLAGDDNAALQRTAGNPCHPNPAVTRILALTLTLTLTLALTTDPRPHPYQATASCARWSCAPTASRRAKPCPR